MSTVSVYVDVDVDDVLDEASPQDLASALLAACDGSAAKAMGFLKVPQGAGASSMADYAAAIASELKRGDMTRVWALLDREMSPPVNHLDYQRAREGANPLFRMATP